MRGNTVIFPMVRGKITYADNLFQYDYGQRLIPTGAELPEAYEVHFSNEENGTTKTVIGDATGVDIPDEFLVTGKPVHVWVYLHTGDSDGETEYHGVIHVTRRSKPTNAEPTPVQQDLITQTIAALNAAVVRSDTNVTHYPQVIDNVWFIWDAENSEFVSTGVIARGGKGDDGNGISSISLNPDYTLTFRYTDGTNYTTGSIRGPQGDQGPKGDPFTVKKTFESIAAMNAYTGTDVVTGDFVVISSDTEDPDNGKLYIRTDSGYRYITDLSGARGMKGDPGPAGPEGPTGQDGYTPTVYAEDIANGKRFFMQNRYGLTFFDIMNGDPTLLINDSSGSGVTTRTWSAGKLYTRFNEKANKSDTVLDTYLSRGRSEHYDIGTGSFAFGNNLEASGEYSHCEGNNATARGKYSHAENLGSKAAGQACHAEGLWTVANADFSHVSGCYNVADSYDSWPAWVPGTLYTVGSRVKRTVGSSVYGYVCKIENSDYSFTVSKWINRTARMNYAEIVGNGLADSAKSNARALDWDGNERLMGDVYVGCNADSTGGTKLAKISDVPAFATDEEVQDIIDDYEVTA